MKIASKGGGLKFLDTTKTNLGYVFQLRHTLQSYSMKLDLEINLYFQ